jgi:D-3-phosphoglycerate dehydrogenase / 2-oxoglutarate reductase
MKILLTSTSFQDTPGQHMTKLQSCGFEIDMLRGPLTANQLLPIIANYDGVICGDDDFNEEVLREGKSGSLKILSKYGIGLDKIDLQTSKELDIKVFSTPGVNHQAVAEHAFALLLSYEKNIIPGNEIVQQNKWKRLIGRELYGKSVGILGLGNVGKEVAKRASAFGMKIFACDIKTDEYFNSKYEVNFCISLSAFSKEIDYLFLTLPLNSQTKNIIDENEFNSFKNDIVIINTARAGLINEKSLVDKLEHKELRAYLTDVLMDEPIINEHPLLKYSNVIITPHVGSRNYETVERQGLKAVLNLLSFFNI